MPGLPEALPAPCARSVCWHMSFSSLQSPRMHACLSAEGAQAAWYSPEGVGDLRALFLLCQSSLGWPGANHSPLKEGVPLLRDGRGWEDWGNPRPRAEMPSEPPRLSLQGAESWGPPCPPLHSAAGEVDSDGKFLVDTSRSHLGEF